MNETEKLNESINKARVKLREHYKEMLQIFNEQTLKVDKYLEEMIIK